MLILKIKTDNAAFCEEDGTEASLARGAELARILRELADELADGNDGTFAVMDVNGNRVGTAQLF